MGLGVSCYRYPVTPLWFSTLCQRSSPSAASPSGFCALAGCVSMSDSSLLVYSWDCAGRVCAVPLGFSPMCHALPRGLQRALLSLMQVHWGFSGHRVSVLLLPWWLGLGFSPSLLFLCFSCSACLQGWPGLYTLCQGAPVTVMSPWFGVWSPGYPSLTLEWVCFWPAVSQAFVVRHDFGFVDAYLTSGCLCRLRLVWVRTAVQPSHRLVLILHPGFLFSGLVERGAFHRVPPPLSSFGMWSPFWVISVFCHF